MRRYLIYRSRRRFLHLGTMSLASLAVATCTKQPATRTTETTASAQPAQLPLTPACDDSDLTPSQTEGPYYTPDSPERTSLLEPGITGTTIILTGQVLSSNCAPIARALVDVWHSDAEGEYDNVGYRLRGHQFTDDAGYYSLETIIPGLYPGRTRHFHVKVQAPNQPVLTTQLYFPEEPQNERDRLFQPALLLAVQEIDDGKQATFNFILPAG